MPTTDFQLCPAHAAPPLLGPRADRSHPISAGRLRCVTSGLESAHVPGHRSRSSPCSPRWRVLLSLSLPAQAVTLTGNGKDNVLKGKGGNDTLKGKGGNDTLKGGGGNDKSYGDAGNDVIKSGDGNDLNEGGSGNDVDQGHRRRRHDQRRHRATTSSRAAPATTTIDGGDGNDDHRRRRRRRPAHDGPGDDTISVDVGNDVIYARPRQGHRLRRGGHQPVYVSARRRPRRDLLRRGPQRHASCSSAAAGRRSTTSPTARSSRPSRSRPAP